MTYSKQQQLAKPKKLTRTQLNKKANRELEKLWIDKDITVCEVSGCTNMNLTNAHRHKRVWYRGKPDHLLWDYEQVARICSNCHQKLEKDKTATEALFNKIRV
jgi:5-methylcytosine-specific restriction endonuclease McrA